MRTRGKVTRAKSFCEYSTVKIDDEGVVVTPLCRYQPRGHFKFAGYHTGPQNNHIALRSEAALIRVIFEILDSVFTLSVGNMSRKEDKLKGRLLYLLSSCLQQCGITR